MSLFDWLMGPPAGSPEALAQQALDREKGKKTLSFELMPSARADVIEPVTPRRDITGRLRKKKSDGTRVPSGRQYADEFYEPLAPRQALSDLDLSTTDPRRPMSLSQAVPVVGYRGGFIGSGTDAQARANNVGGPGRDIYGNLSVVADRLNAQREQMEGERLSKRLAENSRIRRIQDELDARSNADLRKILLAGDLARQNKELEVGAQDRQTQATATYNQIKAALDARDLDRKIRRDQADVGIAERAQTTAERGQSLSEMEFATEAERKAAERDPLSEFNLNKVRENIAGVLAKMAETNLGQINPAQAEQVSDLMMAVHIAQSGTGAVYDPNTNMPIDKETIQALAKERGKTYEQMYKELTVRALQGIGDKFDG